MLQMKSVTSLADALNVMVQASVLSSADASRLTALVQTVQDSSDDESEPGAPAAAVYEGHSEGIIRTLEGLLEKAQAQLDKARKTESSNLQNYQMLKQSLTDEISFANKDMEKAKKTLAESQETKATASGELTALATAKKVIVEATGGAASQSYSFLQLSTSADLHKEEALRFVRDLARKTKDAALTQLASRMSSAVKLGSAAGEDPFAKVKGLITDMIATLESKA